MRVATVACAVACTAALATCGGGADDRAPDAGASAAAPGLVAVQPSAPRGYRVPHGARRVSTSQELRTALASHRRQTIVLSPGTYESRAPFLNPWGHRIYSARLGAAVLRAGLSLGGNDGRPGSLVRGVVVDVDDPARTVDGTAIAVWGTGRAARILDTTVRGHGVLRAGVSGAQPDGLQIRRVRVQSFTDYGIVVDANGPADGRFSVQDVDVAEIGRRQPGSSGGRAESCLWIGNAGTVRRVRARSCAWSGLWTGTVATGAVFDEIDVDDAPTGVYVEHFTTDSTFARLRIGRHVRVGLLAEWADPAWGGRPASVGNVIRDSRFESWLVGVYLDEGTTRTIVRDSAFTDQQWAAIGDFRGRDNRQYANAFRLAAGARPVRHDHLNSFRGG